MNKKVISSVLAGAMALSTMGIVASAADSKNTFTSKASLLEATIDADVPAELNTFINPYGAQVTATAGTTISAVKYSDGIISPTYIITNNDTDAGLKVNATATITPSSTVAVMTKAMTEEKLAKATDKQVFAFLNATKDVASSKPVFASTDYVGNKQQVVFTEDGTKASDIMVLDAKPSSGTAANAGYFYVGGQCTPNPETAWDSKDTITVTLVLDLAPSAGAAADLTLASLTLDSTVTPTPVNIDGKDFDGSKTVYEVAASGSKTKAKSIKVTANFAGKTGGATGASVHVRYNGTFYPAGTNITADDKLPGITFTAAAAGTAGAAVVTPVKSGPSNAEADYNVGDVLEFIVVDAKTNESTTYVINFT